MTVEVLKGGWVKRGSVTAFPYEWQRPAKTEEWVYEYLIDAKVQSIFVEFISFPWATLIDLIERNKWKRANALIEALKFLPSKKTLIRATACQHIKLNCIEKILIELKITDIFWAHKTTSTELLFGIRLHPLALYPVSFFNYGHNDFKKRLIERKLKYSFVGAYDSAGYISNVREKIFEIKNRTDLLLIRRSKWHFELDVYKKQINSLDLSIDDVEESIRNMHEYCEILKETVFSLCPSGAGPNSIRLWESIAFGCIPVVLSNSLDCSVLDNFNYIKIDENSLLDVFKLNLDSLSSQLNINSENINNAFLSNIDSIFENDTLINLIKR